MKRTVKKSNTQEILGFFICENFELIVKNLALTIYVDTLIIIATFANIDLTPSACTDNQKTDRKFSLVREAE